MSDNSVVSQKIIKKDPHQSVAWLLVVLTGSVFLVEVSVMFLLDSLPPLPKTAAVLLDATLLSMLLFPIFYLLVFRPLLRSINERRQAEDELRVAAVAFEINDPILITDAHANIIRCNRMFSVFTGYRPEELIGKNPRIFNSGLQEKSLYQKMWRELLSKGSWSGGIRNRSKEGQVNLCWMTITAVKNEQNEITHYIAIYNRG